MSAWSRPLPVCRALVLPIAIALSVTRGAPAASDASSRLLPPGLPGHFSFGIMNGPDGIAYLNRMRSLNDTAWDIRYAYLAGGVNTGRDWTAWTLPAGGFVRAYADASGRNGYIPAFAYYELLQSDGLCRTCSEPERDLSNLSNPSLMASYYENWRLLMKQLGAFGKPALIIVEPDVWGYVEQASWFHGRTAASVAASVSTSGDVDATGLPNTAQGFAWALLRIRDRYARNVLLALHSSPFGTGLDITSNTDPSVDAVAVGVREASFLNTAGLVGNPSGISSFDLISSDIANRDSALSGLWWDRNNLTYPNFDRYLRFIDAVSSGTSRRIVMWQVPLGNQYFATEDDTPGHMQDNRAEYILQHVAEFASAGIVAVLFGATDGGATTIEDSRADGITNPMPIETYQCTRCNQHVSTYADDDGGYLRIFVGRYYGGGGYPLKRALDASAAVLSYETSSGCAPAIEFGPTNGSALSVAPGSTVTFTSSIAATCRTNALIAFGMYDVTGRKVWQAWQDDRVLTQEPQPLSTSWSVPMDIPTGTYALDVGVFSAGWGAVYGWNGKVFKLLVTDGAPGCGTAPEIRFGPAAATPAAASAGSRIALKVALRASCSIAALLDFEMYDATGQRVWQDAHDDAILTGQLQEFDTTWTVPDHVVSGSYTLKVGVFRAGWGGLYAWNDRAVALTILP